MQLDHTEESQSPREQMKSASQTPATSGRREKNWTEVIFLNKLPVCVSCLSDSGPMSLPSHLPNSYLPKEPPPRATESLSSMTLPLRGPLANSSGSPHLGNMIHPPMPPSCIMEELQRAFASKNRQER